jgi:hypothetical protein
MQIKFVFFFCPSLVFFVDSFSETWKAGEARGPIVRVRNASQDDTALVEHELEHVRQWYTWVFVSAIAAWALFNNAAYWQYALALGVSLHGLLYRFVPAYRQWAEVEAYKVQAENCDTPLETFATFIATDYDLSITPEAALQLLKD